MTWDEYFFSIVDTVSQKSKDQSTKIGCVIVGQGGNILSTGYNSFVRGICDHKPNRQERPEKYYWFEHAERNAIYNAVRSGTSLLNSTLYVTTIPCHDCWRAIIQSGIRVVVIDNISSNYYNKRWMVSCCHGLQMVKERLSILESKESTYILFKNDIYKPFELRVIMNNIYYKKTKENINTLFQTFLKSSKEVNNE